jgi:hypothetical protein
MYVGPTLRTQKSLWSPTTCPSTFPTEINISVTTITTMFVVVKVLGMRLHIDES